MPHAVITGPVSPELAYRELRPFRLKDGDVVLKLGEGYLGRTGRQVLFEATAVEGPPRVSRRFFVELTSRDDGLTVRLNPLTDTEKTEGVRRLVAAVAARVVALRDEARIERSNVDRFLAESGAAP